MHSRGWRENRAGEDRKGGEAGEGRKGEQDRERQEGRRDRGGRENWTGKKVIEGDAGR